jgi:predicted alpha/beta superfamily hydrolase
MRFTKRLFTFLLTLTVFTLHAQVTFILDSIPDYTPVGDEIFIVGDFNNWNPGQTEYVLTKNNNDKWSITLAEQPHGLVILFKFTRGNWETVEKGPDGEEIDNRSFSFGNGLTKHLVVHNWAEGGGESTAAENVAIIDEAFYMPQLDRTRRIWIYLPPGYENTELNYPVMYMHDGQNLFDAQTSFAGEWEVDESLNKLSAEGYQVPIVVGIDNGGGERIDEYSPWINPQYGGGEGEQYIEFIVETLKPFIDENYRTFSDRENTAIMGSSLGGLISHYGTLAHQDIFSKAGIFSPSYWFSDSLWSFTSDAGKQGAIRFYLMCGGMEEESTVPNMLNMADTLKAMGFTDDKVKTKVVPLGQHNENLWRQEFEEAYLWLFPSFANGITFHSNVKPLTLQPNPAKNQITFSLPVNIQIQQIKITDSSGRIILQSSTFSNRSLDVSSFVPGVYFVRLNSSETSYQGKFVKL